MPDDGNCYRIPTMVRISINLHHLIDMHLISVWKICNVIELYKPSDHFYPQHSCTYCSSEHIQTSQSSFLVVWAVENIMKALHSFILVTMRLVSGACMVMDSPIPFNFLSLTFFGIPTIKAKAHTFA